MTPDKARDLLDGTTPAEDWRYSVKGGWVRHLEPVSIDAAGELDVSEDDAALIAAAPTLAAMIAGMRAQYGVEVQRANGDWLPPYSWHDSPEQARICVTALHVRHTANRRLVRRYVTEPEEP